jgi:Cytochrome c3
MTEAGRRSTKRTAIWVVSAVLGVALVAGVLKERAYVQHSRAFCTSSCHAPKTDAHLAAAGHEGIECQACHSISASRGFGLALSKLVGSRGNANHGAVSAASCASCHNARDPDWKGVADTSGHQQHQGVDKLDCLSCHRATSHGKKTATEPCLGCHADVRLHDKAHFDEGAKPDCLSCHNFSLPKSGQAPLTTQACARCHSVAAKSAPKGEGVVPASVIGADVLHGGVDCKLCHDPHAEKKGPARTPPCKECHHIQIGTGNKKLPDEHFECTSCHEQHKPLKRANSKCAGCHEQARARATGPSSTALRHDECASCHLPHAWVPEPNGCVTCHSKQAKLVFGKSPVQHRRCVNCHEVHGPPPSGAVCGSCHKENAQRMRAAPAKHQNCPSCHNPHAPKVQVPTACAACHRTQLAQVVTQGPAAHARESCPGCHVVHGNPRVDTKTCAICHKDKGALVKKARPEEHHRCESCHRQHKFKVDPASPPCLRCHQPLIQNASIHRGNCMKCHTPHGSPAVAQDKCQKCHEKIQLKPPPGVAAHGRCNSCHKPHKAAATARDQCKGCHQDKGKIAALWPAGSAHREACNRCHNQHAVLSIKNCGECHQKEQTSASGGPHQCKFCHSPHQAPASTTKGWWGRCVKCHEKEVTASKAHNKCENCHKPHRFTPPKCKTCHAGPASKGAHQVKQHGECTKCHDAHGATIPGRAQCLACHKDRVDHQPQAQRCQACHLFK